MSGPNSTQRKVSTNEHQQTNNQRTNDSTAETETPIPSKEEIAHYIAERDRRGVIVEWTCAECGGIAVHRALPEEQDRPKEEKVSICRSCIKQIF